MRFLLKSIEKEIDIVEDKLLKLSDDCSYKEFIDLAEELSDLMESREKIRKAFYKS